LRFHKTLVVPVLTLGPETWVLTRTTKGKGRLESTEMSFFEICGRGNTSRPKQKWQH